MFSSKAAWPADLHHTHFMYLSCKWASAVPCMTKGLKDMLTSTTFCNGSPSFHSPASFLPRSPSFSISLLLCVPLLFSPLLTPKAFHLLFFVHLANQTNLNSKHVHLPGFVKPTSRVNCTFSAQMLPGIRYVFLHFGFCSRIEHLQFLFLLGGLFSMKAFFPAC